MTITQEIFSDTVRNQKMQFQCPNISNVIVDSLRITNPKGSRWTVNIKNNGNLIYGINNIKSDDIVGVQWVMGSSKNNILELIPNGVQDGVHTSIVISYTPIY